MPIDASKPAWFNRVYALAIKREEQGQGNYWDPELPINPSDFDEDISDCSSVDSCSSGKGCKFNDEGECTIHGNDAEDSDFSTGSNAEDLDLQYYEMKIQREERKRELKELRDLKRERKKITKEDMDLEISRVKEVVKVWQECKAKKHNEPTILKSLKDRRFTLWSIEHLQWAPDELLSPKFIQFYPMDDSDIRETPYMGHMVTGNDPLCCLDPFIQPKNVGTKSYKLRADEGEREVQIKFIHDNYLAVRISRDLVYINEPDRAPEDAPEFFFYWGICDDYTLAQSRRDKKEKRRRSASPE
ncbi:hypothetical protein ACHAP5_006938 [Fusarium lateritium]